MFNEALFNTLPTSPALSFDNTFKVTELPCDKVAISFLVTGLSGFKGSNTVISNGVNGQPLV